MKTNIIKLGMITGICALALYVTGCSAMKSDFDPGKLRAYNGSQEIGMVRSEDGALVKMEDNARVFVAMEPEKPEEEQSQRNQLDEQNVSEGNLRETERTTLADSDTHDVNGNDMEPMAETTNGTVTVQPENDSPKETAEEASMKDPENRENPSEEMPPTEEAPEQENPTRENPESQEDPTTGKQPESKEDPTTGKQPESKEDPTTGKQPESKEDPTTGKQPESEENPTTEKQPESEETTKESEETEETKEDPSEEESTVGPEESQEDPSEQEPVTDPDEGIIASGDCGVNVRWSLDENGVMRIFGEGEMYDFEGFWYADNRPWFDYKDNIREVNVENGVTSIGNRSFYGCRYLWTVNLPDSVTTIGAHAFQETWFREIKLPANLQVVREYAFEDVQERTILNWPETIEYVGDHAFVSAKIPDFQISEQLQTIGSWALSDVDLNDLYIPATLTFIGEGAFSANASSITVDPANAYYDSRGNCNAIIDKDTNTLLLGCAKTVIPEDVEQIAPYAFSRCNDLEEIRIPDNVKEIGQGAFEVCSNLRTVELPKNVYLNERAFVYSGLERLELPEINGNVAEALVEGCHSLSRVIVQEGVEAIESWAFFDCYNLTEIDLPRSLKTIGQQAFSQCDNLTDIYYNGTEDEWNNISVGVSNEVLQEATVHFQE